MSTGATIARLRQERGMTQGELARRVCVTRQAVSRWETGETTPGIDMVKLLAVTLDAPVSRLLEMPDRPVCQCCGTYLPDSSGQPAGGVADGAGEPADGAGEPADGAGDRARRYCDYCYHDGAFHYGDSMDEVIEESAPYLAQSTGMSLDEAVSLMGAVLPELDYWKDRQVAR